MEGVPEHLAADEGEKPESNPVIDGGDGAGEQRACGPTDKRHERLKAPEEQGDHPAHRANVSSACRGLCRWPRPNASMESPTPVRNNSMKPTANPFFPQGVNVSFSSRKKPSARRSATMESKSGGSTSGRPGSGLGRVQVGEHGRAGDALGSGEHAAG